MSEIKTSEMPVYRIERLDRPEDVQTLDAMLHKMWDIGWKTVSVAPDGSSHLICVFINRWAEVAGLQEST